MPRSERWQKGHYASSRKGSGSRELAAPRCFIYLSITNIPVFLLLLNRSLISELKLCVNQIRREDLQFELRFAVRRSEQGNEGSAKFRFT